MLSLPGLTLTLMFHGQPFSAQTSFRSPIHTQLPAEHCQEALSSPGWQHRACSEGKPRSDYGRGFRAGSSTANSRRDGFQESLSRGSLPTGSIVRNDLSRCNPIMEQRGETRQTLGHFQDSHTPFPASLLLLRAPGTGDGWCSTLTARVTLQVTVEEDSFLAHPTRDRAKIQHSRRPPTRGHLMAVVGTTNPRHLLG